MKKQFNQTIHIHPHSWMVSVKNKMSNYSILCYFSLLISLLFFSSCEKVIDINYEEGSTKFVIEGTVSNLSIQQPTVKLSQTKKFEEDNTFVGISGAVVTIQVNNDTIYSLPETEKGIYTTKAFRGIPGSSYKLNVTINGNTFTALSVMPLQLVPLDAITVEDLSFGGSTSKTIYPDYFDPLGKGNSYRFIEYVNGEQVKAVFVQNDAISDGLRITRPLIYRDGDINSGDNVKVDMLCIDENIYKYWYSLDQASTGNSNATPANPVSNINGGALGYFSAHSISSKAMIVP